MITLFGVHAALVLDYLIGALVLAVSLSFGVKYNRLQWEKSYIGRTTMLSTVGLGVVLGGSMIIHGLGYEHVARGLILGAGLLLALVTHRKHVALRDARSIMKKEAPEATLLDITKEKEGQ